MSERNTSRMDEAFIERERVKHERFLQSQEAADRNFKEALRAAYRDRATRDALAAEIVRTARNERAVPANIKIGEGFEGV